LRTELRDFRTASAGRSPRTPPQCAHSLHSRLASADRARARCGNRRALPAAGRASRGLTQARRRGLPAIGASRVASVKSSSALSCAPRSRNMPPRCTGADHARVEADRLAEIPDGAIAVAIGAPQDAAGLIGLAANPTSNTPSRTTASPRSQFAEDLIAVEVRWVRGRWAMSAGGRTSFEAQASPRPR
jgi:hypothetical protein